MGQPLIHRTQLAASVEAGFVVAGGEASDAEVLLSDFAVSVFVLVTALFESPPSDVIDDEAAPRLSVL
ncbi:MAG: hypothetical protein WB808_00770 [Candidatus Dormiibacterota bacterium]